MIVNQYIDEVIKSLWARFSSISKIMYKYKEKSETHFIRIEPQLLFDSAEFALFDLETTEEFYNNNYPGSLCFISENSFISIEDPDVTTWKENRVFGDFVFEIKKIAKQFITYEEP